MWCEDVSEKEYINTGQVSNKLPQFGRKWLQEIYVRKAVSILFV